jgi:hypothetical protein
MTSEQDAYLLELSTEMDRHLADVVNGVQEAREIRTTAYERADLLAKKVTALLKGRDLLPRRVLLTLDTAAGTLENEAAYSQDPARVREMAQALRMTLGLILRGGAHEDRTPGVPRIT